MVTIGMNYEVLEGKEPTFENAFRKVVAAMKDLSGHQETRLYRDLDAPRRYLIVSQWSEKSAFDDFIASEKFRKVTDWGKEQILAARPHHQVYATANA